MVSDSWLPDWCWDTWRVWDAKQQIQGPFFLIIFVMCMVFVHGNCCHLKVVLQNITGLSSYKMELHFIQPWNWLFDCLTIRCHQLISDNRQPVFQHKSGNQKIRSGSKDWCSKQYFASILSLAAFGTAILAQMWSHDFLGFLRIFLIFLIFFKAMFENVFCKYLMFDFIWHYDCCIFWITKARRIFFVTVTFTCHTPHVVTNSITGNNVILSMILSYLHHHTAT